MRILATGFHFITALQIIPVLQVYNVYNFASLQKRPYSLSYACLLQKQ